MSEPARKLPPRPRAEVAHIDHAPSRREKADWRPWLKTLRQHYPMLGKPAVAIAALLATWANAEGHCYPKHQTLIEATGLSPRTVSDALKQLKAVGAIRYQPGRGREWSHYWLVPHPRPASPAPQTSSTCRSDSPPTSAQPGIPCRADPPPAAPPLGSTSEETSGSSIDPPALPPKLASPPDPPRGESMHACRSQGFPPRPTGRRQRDCDTWLDEVERWAAAEGLPVGDHWNAIQVAALMGRTNRAAFVAHLEAFTDWRDGPSVAEVGDVDASPRAAAPRDGSPLAMAERDGSARADGDGSRPGDVGEQLELL